VAWTGGNNLLGELAAAKGGAIGLLQSKVGGLYIFMG
jgi:hypothetical protein